MNHSRSKSVYLVTYEHIVKGLRQVGVTAGSSMMLHSSLKSLGYVENGAQTVIKALMDVLTPEGTLLLPSFNHGIPFRKGGQGYFHPNETPTTNGIIPDTFWRMSGVYRSLNPTHSFAAWGKHSRQYVEFHHQTLTMGPKSPLGLLYANGGFCLLLGVDYRSNTFHHVVEMSTGAPCLGLRTEAYPMVLPDGRIVEGRTWSLREKSCHFTDGGKYYEEMESRNLQREVRIGRSRGILFQLQDCFEVIAEILRRGKNGFPPCFRCSTRPRQVPHTVPSDWDIQKQRLFTESAAWSY
ncbi:MAG: AAC(3) family N-acetyltransferase [Thermodesulfobacteriota bacterium]|nr:AAC(3) family N-acetyltransferase [Thermodesulfobacteriota bacterium]